MKKFLSIIIFLVLFQYSHGQSGMQLSQGFQNASTLNPAFTGIDNFMDIKVGYRQQWTGITDGPQIYYLTVNGVLVKPKYESIRSNALRISDPELYSETGSNNFNRISAIKHGLGGHILNDSYGPFNQLKAALSYGFHFPINQQLRFTVGASGGIVNTRVNADKVRVDEEFEGSDATYQSFLDSSGQSTNLDIGLGLLLYSRNFYVGYSATNLTRNTLLANVGMEIEKEAVTHALMGGVKFQLGADYQLLPSITYRSIEPFPGSVDYSLKMRFRKSFWSGLTYRDNKDLVIMTGFFLNNSLNINYSYDFSLGGMNDQLKGSHEFVIGFSLFNTTSALPYAW